ncbi:MAG: hypothetical protein ABS69_10710 [Nitrosomonadales bacterium SCN 54-20]|nr:MAG: hypothetical protein ABS69_10710 [Nitrosomonadales bacterium SCN 54-20]
MFLKIQPDTNSIATRIRRAIKALETDTELARRHLNDALTQIEFAQANSTMEVKADSNGYAFMEVPLTEPVRKLLEGSAEQPRLWKRAWRTPDGTVHSTIAYLSKEELLRAEPEQGAHGNEWCGGPFSYMGKLCVASELSKTSEG